MVYMGTPTAYSRPYLVTVDPLAKDLVPQGLALAKAFELFNRAVRQPENFGADGTRDVGCHKSIWESSQLVIRRKRLWVGDVE